MKALYEHEGKIVYDDDLIKALQSVGIQNGDTIFVHSRVSAFGTRAPADRATFLKILTETLERAVGETGTIIMPTFTYSFCNNESFDIEHSPSTVGVLTDFFRKEPGVFRTRHPIFSVAIKGPLHKQLSIINEDSFGEKSIFGNLKNQGGKFVFLGAPFSAFTFLHHIEQMYGVPYRYFKEFRGTIVGNTGGDVSSTYFVRKLNADIETDTSRLQKHLTDLGCLKSVTVGGGEILSVNAKDAYREGRRMLEEDVYSFLTHPPLSIDMQ